MKNKIMIEELITLISGGKIQFTENPKLIIYGDDLGLSETQIEMILNIINMNDNEANNTYDILSRYNNSEYWYLQI